MENIENSESKKNRGALLTSVLVIAFMAFFAQSIAGIIGMVGSSILTVVEVGVNDVAGVKNAGTPAFVGPFFYSILLLIAGIFGLVSSSSIWKLKKSGAVYFYISSIITMSLWLMVQNWVASIVCLIFILTIYFSKNRLN